MYQNREDCTNGIERKILIACDELFWKSHHNFRLEEIYSLELEKEKLKLVQKILHCTKKEVFH